MFGFFYRCLQRRCHHNHSRTSAKGAVVNIAEFVVGEFAGIDGLELPKVLFFCATGYAVFGDAVEHFGEDGDGLNQHQ